MATPSLNTVVDDVLYHCIYALGAGAKMHIKSDAIHELRSHIRKSFKKQIAGSNTTGGAFNAVAGMQRWNQVSQFMLGCSETIGALAASKAIARGSSAIELEDLKAAYNVVSHKHQDQPGSWCPEMD
jgi:hypothetical protein